MWKFTAELQQKSHQYTKKYTSTQRKYTSTPKNKAVHHQIHQKIKTYTNILRNTPLNIPVQQAIHQYTNAPVCQKYF